MLTALYVFGGHVNGRQNNYAGGDRGEGSGGDYRRSRVLCLEMETIARVNGAAGAAGAAGVDSAVGEVTPANATTVNMRMRWDGRPMLGGHRTYATVVVLPAAFIPPGGSMPGTLSTPMRPCVVLLGGYYGETQPATSLNGQGKAPKRKLVQGVRDDSVVYEPTLDRWRGRAGAALVTNEKEEVRKVGKQGREEEDKNKEGGGGERGERGGGHSYESPHSSYPVPPPMITPRFGAVAAVIGDRIYMCGGRVHICAMGKKGDATTASVESWRYRNTYGDTSGTSGPSSGTRGEFSESSERSDPSCSSWRPESPMGVRRWCAGAVRTVYQFDVPIPVHEHSGGGGDAGDTNAEEKEPNAKAATAPNKISTAPTAPAVPVARAACRPAILVLGGLGNSEKPRTRTRICRGFTVPETGGGGAEHASLLALDTVVPLRSCEIFDPPPCSAPPLDNSLDVSELGGTCGTWYPGPSLRFCRIRAAVVEYGGLVFAIGGCDEIHGKRRPLASVEVLDPSQPQRGWLLGPMLPAPRYAMAAVAVPGQGIYLVGGKSKTRQRIRSVLLLRPDETGSMMRRGSGIGSGSGRSTVGCDGDGGCEVDDGGDGDGGSGGTWVHCGDMDADLSGHALAAVRLAGAGRGWW